jgi:surface protein
MDTASKLNKLLETKEQIRHSIEKKGVEIGKDVPFADYPNYISYIKGEGGGNEDLTGSYVIARYDNNLEEGYKFTEKVIEMDVSHLDIGNMRKMHNMFSNYNNLKSLDLSSWDVSNVEDMGYMFANCNNLQILDLSNFDMNNVNGTTRMLSGCDILHTLRLDNCSAKTIKKIVSSYEFPTGYVFDEPRKMFVTASEVGTFPIPDGWQCIDKKTGEVIEVEIGDPYIIATFNTTESVEIMNGGWASEFWLTSYDEGATWEENSNETRGNEVVYLKPRNVNDICLESLFDGRGELTSTEFFNFSYYSLNDNISNMFKYCDNLTTINGISNWDTSNVREMHEMFNGCRALTTLDLNNWDTSNVERMQNMFHGCESLEELILSNWNTSNVEEMQEMFNNCRNLHTLELNNFDMSNVRDTGNMFRDCERLQGLVLNNCSADTIRKMLESEGFPTGEVEINGNWVPRVLYCQEGIKNELMLPDGWVFAL